MCPDSSFDQPEGLPLAEDREIQFCRMRMHDLLIDARETIVNPNDEKKKQVRYRQYVWENIEGKIDIAMNVYRRNKEEEETLEYPWNRTENFVVEEPQDEGKLRTVYAWYADGRMEKYTSFLSPEDIAQEKTASGVRQRMMQELDQLAREHASGSKSRLATKDDVKELERLFLLIEGS